MVNRDIYERKSVAKKPSGKVVLTDNEIEVLEYFKHPLTDSDRDRL